MSPGEELMVALGKEIFSAQNSAPSPLPEAQVMTLREVFARYAAGCPFKPGDLVTPHPGMNQKKEGAPHIVLELSPFGDPMRNFHVYEAMDIYTESYGERLDMRVAVNAGGLVRMFWVPSWKFTPYAPAEGEGS